jgi:hypothetical protein
MRAKPNRLPSPYPLPEGEDFHQFSLGAENDAREIWFENALFPSSQRFIDPFSLREKVRMRAKRNCLPSPYPLPEGEGFQQTV